MAWIRKGYARRSRAGGVAFRARSRGGLVAPCTGPAGTTGAYRHRSPRVSWGQSVVELALLVPLLVLLLLGAFDFAQVASAQQRLAHGAHLATLRLRTTPSLDVASYIQAASGLSPVSATTAYARGAGGADRVVVTGAYGYPLLTPGLRNLRTRTISDGKLHITVQAAGIATTSAPTLSQSGTTLTAAAPSDATVPTGLVLTCTLYRSGSQLRSGPCPQSVGVVPGDVYTATVTQNNGVVSPPSAPVRGTRWWRAAR